MKKQIAAAIAAVTALTSVQGLAATPEKTEISFKVGDSVLTVNGAPLEVTAPYVVGEGTTLVPVRVITEAFGAEVNWNGEDQSVNLKYPEVDITIKIGSKSASVNTHTEELAAPPELYNGTTMVPLRFISETFGAKVEYNDATRLITVIKEAPAEQEAQTVQGTSDMEFIGDSFYGWTMKNPKKFKMEDRTFDGQKTIFKYDDDNYIAIYVNQNDEEFSVDDEFSDLKELFSSGTLSNADKTPQSDGSTKIHFRGKSKDIIMDAVEYVNGKSAYRVVSFTKPDSDMKDEISDITDSFSITAKDRQIYELSNVKDGKREFRNEELKLSIMLPASWSQTNGTPENEMEFRNPLKPREYAHVSVYSKSSTVDAKKLAEKDRQHKVNISNQSLSEISEVDIASLCGQNGFRYTASYSGLGDNTYVLTDSFCDLGNYVYNIAVTGADIKEAEAILSTLKIEEIDYEKVGSMIRSSDIDGTITADLLEFTLEMPKGWLELNPAVYLDQETGGLFTASILTSKDRVTPTELIKDYIESQEKNYDILVTQPVANKTSHGKTFYYCTIESTDEENDSRVYTTIYSCQAGNKLYLFLHTTDDIYHDGSRDKEIADAVMSLEDK